MTDRRTIGLSAAAVVVAGAAVLIAYAPWQEGAPNQPVVAIDWRDQALVTAGADIYAQQCASCHGVNLEGQADWQTRGADGLLPAPPHDQTGHTWHHPDALLFELTKYGPAALAGGDYQSAMPAYDAILTDDQIMAVLAYVKSTWPEAIRDRHDQLNAAVAEQR